jgi:hypothetical protein
VVEVDTSPLSFAEVVEAVLAVVLAVVDARVPSAAQVRR